MESKCNPKCNAIAGDSSRLDGLDVFSAIVSVKEEYRRPKYNFLENANCSASAQLQIV